MKSSPKLLVFCPVDPAELESTPDGVICRKCQKGLVDVSTSSGAQKLTDGVCGVMRRYIAPVVGSSIALSGCSFDGGTSGSDQQAAMKAPINGSSPEEQDVPLPGTYFYPGGENHKHSSYPIAERSDDPGIVISPYTQSKVDVSHVPEGTLVLDPAFKMSDKKFFRVPATPKP